VFEIWKTLRIQTRFMAIASAGALALVATVVGVVC